ncbi:MAG TPA: nucleoside-diphosphate kinase [Actinomycetota bacterium]|nr:nucleoside-diphosphate kinase [Actinomycetota bacterium]
MTTESTLLIIKPDAVRRGLVGEILRRIESKGLRIAEMRMTTIERELAEEHYDEHREKAFFEELVGFITSGPVIVARIEGENAIEVWRSMMGPTDPKDAPAGTVRGDFGTVITENLVHGSDSSASAERELKLFFA